MPQIHQLLDPSALCYVVREGCVYLTARAELGADEVGYPTEASALAATSGEAPAGTEDQPPAGTGEPGNAGTSAPSTETGANTGAGDGAASPTDLNALSYADLKSRATAAGIDLGPNPKKETLIAALAALQGATPPAPAQS